MSLQGDVPGVYKKIWISNFYYTSTGKSPPTPTPPQQQKRCQAQNLTIYVLSSGEENFLIRIRIYEYIYMSYRDY
jgi:hypothetical protein